MKKNVFIRVAVLSLLTLILSGCTMPQSSKIVTGGIVSTNLEEGTIQIKNYSYDPSDINIKGGATLTITNNDSVAHSVTADKGEFDTGLIQPNQTVKLIIPENDGKFGFYCTPHPYMRGTLNVTDSPDPTPVD